MKKHLILPTEILIMSCMMLSVSAQEVKPEKKVNIEFGIGMNFSGPQQQMVDLMKNYGYVDTPEIRLFINGSYPLYSNTGFTANFSCSYQIASRSHLGIMLNYSAFGDVKAYSSDYGHLSVRLSTISVIPIYTYEFEKILELQAGCGLMINSGGQTFAEIPISKKQNTKYTPGLFTGLNFKLWDRKACYGKIGTYYLFTSDSSLGPYTSSSLSSLFYLRSFTVPESKINFSHLNVAFTFGFKL